MNKCIRISAFAKELFVDQKAAEHARQIMAGIMTARSPRLSDIAATMPGSEAASYKRIQRFLQRQEPEEALRLLFNEEADFVIGDPTEIERPPCGQDRVCRPVDGWTDERVLDADPGHSAARQSHPLSFSDLFVAHV